MKMVSDWHRVVLISLSFWMQVAGLLVLIAPEIRYAWTGQDYDPVTAWWAGVLLLLAGLAGRLLRQGLSPLREWLRIAGVIIVTLTLALLLATYAHARQPAEADTLDVAVPFIAAAEGKRNVSYRDIVGVWTICFGSTRGIGPGMTMTDVQCLALLRAEVAEYRAGLHRYFTNMTRELRLTAERDAAYTSLAFNAGIGAIGKSTATRRLNAGNIADGCEALTWWTKAGGRVIRGLSERRKREKALCMAGLE